MRLAQPIETKQKSWLRGVDLNHRPLGYEFCEKRNFNELAGVVAKFKEWRIARKSVKEFLFWVGLGLESGDRISEFWDGLRRDLGECYLP
jgi:hypothetical protein